MENRKIKSVRRKDTGLEYEKYLANSWRSKGRNIDQLYEMIAEEIILNCPLFEVEYKPEPKIWRAEYGKEYDAITDTGGIVSALEGNRSIDIIRHELGNYFRPVNDADENKRVREEIAEVFARSKARRAK